MLTTWQVLELYKAPLRVEGWDVALMETARLGKEHTQGDLSVHLAAARQLPTLVVTATYDYIATPAKVWGIVHGVSITWDSRVQSVF